MRSDSRAGAPCANDIRNGCRIRSSVCAMSRYVEKKVVRCVAARSCTHTQWRDRRKGI